MVSNPAPGNKLIIMSLEILLLLLSINHPFVHPVDSTQYFDTFVTELGSTYPLLTILVSFLSGKKWGIIQTTSTHLIRRTIDNKFNIILLLKMFIF